MNTRPRTIISTLGEIWSPTTFESSDIVGYALPHITAESQRGVATLSLASLAFLLVACMLSAAFNFGTGYVYTYGLLAALSLHVYLSTRSTVQLTGLYLLAMVLLVVCGSSLVLVAQQTGKLDLMMFASVAALFMLVPVVPWGLREALIVVSAIYFMFTASLLLTGSRFTVQDFWVLQFLMLFAALVSVTLVIRALLVRKHDLRTQFGLVRAHGEMRHLLDRDHLTGAWNRRFLENNFDEILQAYHGQAGACCFAVIDIDRFKQINDTFGHREGDRVLRAVADSFGHLLGKNEYVVRMGGDEFVLLMRGDQFEGRLQDALAVTATSLSAATGGAADCPGLSVGVITIPPGMAMRLDQAYKMADEAQYEAKRAGGNRVVRLPAALPQRTDVPEQAKA